MEQKRLGTQGLTVSAMGLGCMGMSDAYGPADETESIATIHRALDLGINLLDTSDAYGPMDGREGFGLVGGPVGIAHTHAAESHRGDGQTLLAESLRPHVPPPR